MSSAGGRAPSSGALRFSVDNDSLNFLCLPHAVRACFAMPSMPCYASPLRHAFCENTFSFTVATSPPSWSGRFGYLALVDALRGPLHLTSHGAGLGKALTHRFDSAG